jgi:pimeloyl-ACP methyl ester carboxylesterase
MTLTDSEARARESSLAAEAADTEQSRRARVKHVVVVLHGIRDEGAWAGRFRDIINGQMELADVHVSSERFPWIPMISFFFDIGGARERNVRWLADKYVRLTAQYPRLEKISFIGHSYGTYVFANCLQRYATIRFHNVFLAGCVLPRNFSWTELKDQGRFSRLCNAVASADTVVAVFPGFFEWLRRWFGGLNQSQFFSLGDAGFAGFEQQAANSEELTYLKGGHGAFLEAPKAPEYAATFVVQDDLADAAALSRARTALDRAGGRVSARDPQVVRLNHFAVLVFLLALILLAAIVVLASAALHGLALWGEGGVISEIWRPSLLAGLLVAAVLFVILNSF